MTVLVAVIPQTSFMRLPLGIALYDVRSVVPTKGCTMQIYVPFLAIQLQFVGIVAAFPRLSRKSLNSRRSR